MRQKISLSGPKDRKAIVYLSGSIDAQYILSLLRDAINKLPGYEVRSRWLDEDYSKVNKGDHIHLSKAKVIDNEDIDACDIFIIFTGRPSTTGMMWYELGRAEALGNKLIIRVGENSNIPALHDVNIVPLPLLGDVLALFNGEYEMEVIPSEIIHTRIYGISESDLKERQYD